MERLGVQHFRLSVEPPGDVPIYLAAVNPKMLRLAGALADGVDMPIILPFTPEADSAPAYERTIAAFRVSPSG
jgi:alkanesulfonate monooxygenase SsuD/methylene tetrahydromethanopterin reductase-like flavin-dependent oxidoreductase (luciferase family)